VGVPAGRNHSDDLWPLRRSGEETRRPAANYDDAFSFHFPNSRARVNPGQTEKESRVLRVTETVCGSSDNLEQLQKLSDEFV